MMRLHLSPCLELGYSNTMNHLLKSTSIICLIAIATAIPANAEKLVGAPVRISPSPLARYPENKQAAIYFREAEKRGFDCDVDGCIEYYSKALSLDPQNSSAYEARGTALLIKRQFLEAKEDFDKSISIDKNDYLSYWGRGTARHHLKDLKGTLDDFNAAIRLCQTDWHFYDSRSRVRLELGDKAGAIADADKAIAVAPKTGWAYYSRSRLRAEMGDRVGAIDDLQKAGSLDSRFGKTGIPRYIPEH
jgi:tetratricopeptide (TPR) repeat protein